MHKVCARRSQLAAKGPLLCLLDAPPILSCARCALARPCPWLHHKLSYLLPSPFFLSDSLYYGYLMRAADKVLQLSPGICLQPPPACCMHQDPPGICFQTPSAAVAGAVSPLVLVHVCLQATAVFSELIAAVLSQLGQTVSQPNCFSLPADLVSLETLVWRY